MTRHIPTALCVLALIVITGCQTQNQGAAKSQRIETRAGDKSWQLGSDNLVEATDAAVAGIAAAPDLARDADGRTIIVLDRVENNMSDQSIDQQIYLARIRALLNESGAKAHLAFVETRYKAQAIRQREGIPDSATSRTRPRYALSATFSDLPRKSSVYYLLTFQLVDLTNDLIAWEGSYEVKL